MNYLSLSPISWANIFCCVSQKVADNNCINLDRGHILWFLNILEHENRKKSTEICVRYELSEFMLNVKEKKIFFF